MGKLIQCSSPIADRPFFFRITGTNVYSMEEVCYYIKENIYILDENLFDQSFASWVREELHMDELAEKLENLFKENDNLRDIVVTLCCSCDYYGEQEINGLINVMDKIADLPVRSRRKIKADNNLRCGACQKAYEEYQRILNSQDMLEASEEEYIKLYNNMGVALARLGNFAECASIYEQAYARGAGDDALKHCVFALRLMGDKKHYQSECERLKIPEDKLKSFEKEYVEADSQGLSSKQIKRIEKLKSIRDAGNDDEYNSKVMGYIQDWKESYRLEISV